MARAQLPAGARQGDSWVRDRSTLDAVYQVEALGMGYFANESLILLPTPQSFVLHCSASLDDARA